MEIDKMIEELLRMDIVNEDNTLAFSADSEQLIHKIAAKCSSIPIVDETREQAEAYAEGLSAEEVYLERKFIWICAGKLFLLQQEFI